MSDDTRMSLLENNIGHISETLKRLEKKMDDGFSESRNDFQKLDHKIEKLSDKTDNQIEKLSDKVDGNFKWLIGTMISLFLITVIASFLHH